jgi:2,4-didehydro-3-deoxy-L-rhamnonate hydrolase
MAVAVVRFESEGRVGWGVVRGDRLQRLCESPLSTGDFIRNFDAEHFRFTGEPSVPLLDVQILSPITRDQQFICLGANYRQHMIESGIDPDVKRFNMVFTKSPGSIVPFDSELIRPRCVHFLDYEIELGIVIKKGITHRITVTEENLGDYVAGIVMLNDYSARDIQIPEGQFYKGKSFRTFAPIGPYLCLLQPGEMHYLRELQLTLTVNGEVRQKDCTSNLVFGPAETLTELSGVHDLAPGDLIATGTPSGCALTVPTPLKQRLVGLLPERKKWEIFLKIQARRTQYLKPGDVVESRIKSTDNNIDLGVQRNQVVEEV